MDILVDSITASIIVYIIGTLVNIVCFLLGYSLLRLFHLPLDWILWMIAGYILLTSCLLAIPVLIHQSSLGSDYANGVGTLGFLVSVHAANQWPVRHLYVSMKKGPPAPITAPLRALLLFLRKHHQLLGSLTLLTALSHMIFYVPSLPDLELYKVATGFAALGVLLLLVLLGLWMVVKNRLYRKPIPRVIKNVHTFLGIVFLLSLALHI